MRILCLILILSGLAVAQPVPAPSPSPAAVEEVEDPFERAAPPTLEDPLKVPANWEELASGASPMKVDEALGVALNRNPDVKAADADARQQYWAWQAGRSLPTGTLGLSTWQGNGTALVNGNFIAQNRSDYYIQFVQPFAPFGSQSAADRSGLQQYRESLLTASHTRVRITQQVKDAFYQLMAAQRQVKVAEENQALALQVYEIAKKRFDSGAGPRLDLLNAGIISSQSEQELVSAVADLNQARDRLNPLLGLPAHAPVTVVGPLEPPALPYVYEVLNEFARTSPRVASAETALEKLKAQVKLASTKGNPTPSMYAVYDINVPSYVIWAQLQFPLDWGQISNDVRSRQEAVEEQMHTLESTLLAVSSELKQAYDAYQAAAYNAARYQEKVLKPSEESSQITQFGYKQGALTYTALLTAQQRLQEVRIEYVSVLLKQRLAFDALEAAVGRALEGEKK